MHLRWRRRIGANLPISAFSKNVGFCEDKSCLHFLPFPRPPDIPTAHVTVRTVLPDPLPAGFAATTLPEVLVNGPLPMPPIRNSKERPPATTKTTAIAAAINRPRF